MISAKPNPSMLLVMHSHIRLSDKKLKKNLLPQRIFKTMILLSSRQTKMFVATLVALLLAAIAIGSYVAFSEVQKLNVLPSPTPTIGPVPQTTNLPPPTVSSARNWAGYVVVSDLSNPSASVVGVSASWIVPSVTDIGIDAFSAVWVGIGGQFDNSLIQTGTEQDVVGGLMTYSAWYELLPADSVTIDAISVSPGDQMEASISLTNSGKNQWTISLSDLTSGQKFQKTVTYKSSRLSAEWIVERPEVNNVLSPLADFGNLTFANCQAVFTQGKGAINDFPSSEVLMDAQVRRGQSVKLVDVSSLENQGTKFSVSYIG